VQNYHWIVVMSKENMVLGMLPLNLSYQEYLHARHHRKALARKKKNSTVENSGHHINSPCYVLSLFNEPNMYDLVLSSSYTS